MENLARSNQCYF